MMKIIYVDLYIYIGCIYMGKLVKIIGVKILMLYWILEEVSEGKGIEFLGIIDCYFLEVIEEIECGIEEGRYCELKEGGIWYWNIMFLLGSEFEIYDYICFGLIYVFVFMLVFVEMKMFFEWFVKRFINIYFSLQCIYEIGLNF